MPKPIPTEEFADHFWSRVNKEGPIPPHIPEIGECWLWTGALKENGYGACFVKRVPGYAHRVAYRLSYGDFPKCMHVLHRCDNPPCVRPDHLFLGTRMDNVVDMMSKGRAPVGERSGNAKLSNAQVSAIRALCAIRGGLTVHEKRLVAAAVQVSRSHLNDIISGRKRRSG